MIVVYVHLDAGQIYSSTGFVLLIPPGKIRHNNHVLTYAQLATGIT